MSSNVVRAAQIRLSAEVIKAVRALNSTLKALLGERRYHCMVNYISNVPMVRPLFYFVYFLLSRAVIVQPKGGSFWLVRLPGKVKFFAPDCHGPVNNIISIWREGAYDRYKPGKSHVVFDAGAHIGIYTVKASKEVGRKGIVVAIEPHPVNFECLKKNLELNDCTNVIPVNVALASSCGETNLFLNASSGGHSTALRMSDNYISVRTTTLDQLVRDLGLTNVHLIKINVEGATLDLLKGAEETLGLHKPKIMAAVGHYPAETAEAIRFLSDEGFLVSSENQVICGQNQMIYAEAK
jgi:FkbM family methyltransferase